MPPADLPGAFAHRRSWFAGRGEGLVAIAKPDSFNWPGYWLAVLGETRRPASSAEEATAVLMFGTPSGVVLSPQNPQLLGRAATDLPITEGYVLSGLDPASLTATSSLLPTLSGTVEVIALSEQAPATCTSSSTPRLSPTVAWQELATPPRRAPSPRPTTRSAATTSP